MPTNTIADVFTRKVNGEPLALETERAYITRAKASPGDSEAWNALFTAYGRALRNAVKTAKAAYSVGYVNPDVDELRSRALEGFVTAVGAVDLDKHDRLAALLVGHLAKAMFQGVDLGAGLNVPPRMKSRYYAIRREAGGDLAKAEAIAPQHDMSVEAFRAITAAVGVGSLEAAVGDGEARMASSGSTQAFDGNSREWGKDLASLTILDDRDSFVSIEDKLLADMALDAVSAPERDVALLAYGFASYDEPLIDAEVAERLLTSRSRVQRLRMSGLEAMRDALGARVD